MGVYDYGYNYGYDYGYDYAQPVAEGVAGFLLVVFLLIYLMMLVFAVVSYVLQALGMHAIAKRRGIHHSWLAWVPVGSAWLLGSISDQYQYVAKGRVRNRRKVLLGLQIALYAIFVFIYACAFALGFSYATEEGVLVGALVAILLLAYFAMLVLAVIEVVFLYIAFYDLFASCDPGNAVLQLVLSILLGVTLPFFVFFSRKKDLGMPQRAPTPQPEVRQLQPVEEPEPQPEAPEQEPPESEDPEQEPPESEDPEQEAPAVEEMTDEETLQIQEQDP